MKKLLMITVLSLFAVSAFAVEATFYGEYELGGRFINNVTLGEGSEEYPTENAAYLKHLFRAGANLNVDDFVVIGARTTALDRRMGMTNVDGVDNPDTTNIELDRAWVAYKPMAGLRFTGGRYDGGNYEHRGFGTGWYNGLYEEMGGRDMLRIDYAPNDQLAFFLVGEKYTESSLGLFVGSDTGRQLENRANGRDTDAYILGADITIDDLSILPRFTYTSIYDPSATGDDSRTNLMSGYVGFGYNPREGFGMDAAGAFITGNNSGLLNTMNTSDGFEDYTAFGFFIEPHYAMEALTIGLTFAYASYDKDSGYFEFGGDFDRTIIMDRELVNSAYGVPAMMTAQLFIDYKINRFTISPRAAYYMSNVDGTDGVDALYGVYGEYGLDIIEDTTVMEFDLLGHYQWTNSTGITAGVAYAMINDLDGGADTYSPDGVMMLLWDVHTAF